MSSSSQKWLACCGAAALCISGCAASRDAGQSAWLKLPSPWATVQAADMPPEPLTRAKNGPSDAARAAKRKTLNGMPAHEQEPIALALLRGRNFERSGEFDKARQLYEELDGRHPGDPRIAHRLGVVADFQRRHAEAERYFQAALAGDPLNADVLGDLGYCYFLQGQLSKAESAFTKAAMKAPTIKRNRNNLGLVLGHLGRHEEALAHFRLANPEADACYNLAFIFAAQDRVAEAKECFQMALNADPTHRPSREAIASFEDYEQLPEHMRDLDTLADGEVRWVPFVEGGGSRGEVAQAGGETVTSRDASRVTRALHHESRGMLNRNMQSQRNVEPAADAGQ